MLTEQKSKLIHPQLTIELKLKIFVTIWNTVARTIIPLLMGTASIWLTVSFPARETIQYTSANGEKVIEVLPSLPAQLAPLLLTSAASFLSFDIPFKSSQQKDDN